MKRFDFRFGRASHSKIGNDAFLDLKAPIRKLECLHSGTLYPTLESYPLTEKLEFLLISRFLE
jgi:hypothetical protein